METQVTDATATREAPERLFLGKSRDQLDPEAVETGVWREWPGPRRKGLRVRIRPAARFNPHFRRAIQNRVRQFVETNGDAEDAEVDLTPRYEDAEFVVEALVADIEGICRADGSEVDYTRDIGVALLSDPANEDVLDWVSNEAHDFGHFYTVQVEEDEKNS